MKSRIRKILDILLKSELEQSLKSLSLKLDVSEKTIREEINQFVKNQKDYPVQIININKGYRTVIKDNEEIESFLKNLDTMSLEGSDRLQPVIKKLLLNGEYIKIETLADELFVSVPTMNRIIKNIKQILAEYELVIKTRPNYGICIAGDEINKRLCYVHFLTKTSDSNIDSIANQCNMKQEDYYSIDFIIRKAIEEKKYDLTETGIKNLTIHLMYAINRMRSGSFIDEISLNYEISREESEIAQDIINQLEDVFQLTFPPTEMDYIRVHLLSKRGNVNPNVVHISPEVEQIIGEINEKIKDVAGLDFNNDLELLSMLSLHIEPMFSRIQYRIDIPNPVLKEIKLRFPTAYECAVIAADYIRERYNLKVSDDELGYLSLHYNLALERLNEGKMQKVLVVCGSGVGTAKLLQHKIENQFHIDRNKITLCSLREIKDMNLTEFDFIVSSVKIPDSKGKKVIMVEDILSNLPSSTFEDRYSLVHYLNFDLVFFHQDLKTREEVIDFCCNRIIEVYKLQDDFKKEVWKRENLSSTDIGNLVAIPHAFTMCTQQTIFCICTLKKAITWNHHKVKYVFLISFGKNDLEISHDINEKLISLILDARWVGLLDSVNTFEELQRILV